MGLTHLGSLNLSGALTAAGTVTSVKSAVTGTTMLSGNVTATGSGKSLTVGSLKVASAANSMSGKRYIATAGTNPFSIATTKALTSSRIMVTPQVKKPGTVGPLIHCSINTIASGVGFSVKLGYGVTPTGCTGVVNWFIVNK